MTSVPEPSGADQPVGSRRLKNLTLLAGILVSGLTLLTWTGVWVTLSLPGSDSSVRSLSITGDVAAPGLVALALAGLALVGALALSGPVFRIFLGLLQAVLGFTVTFSAIIALRDPIGASAASITAATGVSGKVSVAALVGSVALTPWPYVAVLVGVLTILLGIIVTITGRRWPGSSRRYQRVRFEPADDRERAVADWDTLSEGTDPTSR